MTDLCVFCDIEAVMAERPVEQHYAADSSTIWAFEPRDPVVPGHVLVVPKRHVADATEDPYITAMTMSVASRVAQRHRSANIITSIGTPASQTIFHLHVHVVPRVANDGLLLPWSKR